MNQDERRELLAFAQRLLGIDSPSGYTMHAMQFLQEEAEKLGFSCVRSAKGNLMVTIPGKDHAQACALSAQAGCVQIELSCSCARHDAHRFYARKGMCLSHRRYIKTLK